jgi:hypothetical protein
LGWLDGLRRRLGGPPPGGRAEARTHWVYARCARCGEPLRGRVDLMNELSLDEDGESWIVRKGLMGSGANYCFNTVEVTLCFDAHRRNVVDASAQGGSIITEERYQELIAAAAEPDAPADQ